MRKILIQILLVIVPFVGFSHPDGLKKGKETEIKIDPEITFQTIHNFGASDAWSCQFVGNWPEEQKNRIADLLFSLDENVDGSPKGIGLSCWRFNIGAGSTEQVGDTRIGDPWRRAECFLQANGTYDWTKQKGQRWFLQAAKQRGVESFIGFVNSPPVWFTKNGRANSDGGNSMNLREENLSKFSEFLVEVTKNIQKNDHVLFDYLSPVNEPQWDWKNGQEGSPWKNSEIALLCKILGNDLKNVELTTKISIAEAGQLTHLYDRGNDMERGFQIENFFSKQSENYIGDVSQVAHKISGHSYFTVRSDSVLFEVRNRVHEKILEIDPTLEFWMSEYCILEGNGVLKGGGRDLGMETALFVANIIHYDLTVANAGAWQWWLAVSPYNFKDGLVYIDKSETGGEIYESKLLWAMGNYSRFIRPGAKRISSSAENYNGLKVSAFMNTNGSLVMVIINRDQESKNIRLLLPEQYLQSVQYFETSENKNLSKMGNVSSRNTIEISPRSVSTFLITE